MLQPVKKPLQILNASAGSGKTFNLVMTYLKLILGPDKSVDTFAHIMAMTFTNKAAHEMKSRIITALDDLANAHVKSENEAKKANQYALQVSEEIGISTNELQTKAQKALKQLLHRYEDFHVMTIDKFNLRLIRSFSKDLDLPADFQIILNEDEVLDQVIDQILDNLDEKNQKKLTEIVLNYSREKLNEEEGWNFQRDLKNFAKVLTNEKYFVEIEQLMLGDYSNERYAQLKLDINQLKAEIEQKASQLFTLFSTVDENLLPGKTNNSKAFAKLVDTTKLFEGNIDNESFFTNAMLKNFEKTEYDSSLARAAGEFQLFYSEKTKDWRFKRLLRKNFYNMALLQFVYTELEDVKQSEQLIRISEFNKLISNLIKNEDAPFIYEKLGNRFHHFLLDEFQDTSRLQWMNIVPLMHESLGKEKENLIVGDPKQSIYRFKNGLAEQFVALPEIYNPEREMDIIQKSSFFKSMGEKKPLLENWRSSQEIVNFNNAFFTILRASDQVVDSSKVFYEDVVQIPKGKSGGMVKIYSEKKSEDKDLEDAQTLFLLNSWVEECIADGIPKGDICILGYTKGECNRWANVLSGQGHKVVSADSLLVDSDHTVKLSIAYLKWRKNPSGELEGKRFVELFYARKNRNSIENISKFWKTRTRENGKEYAFFDIQSFLIQEFGSEENFFFPFETIYRLMQGFYQLIEGNEIQNPYLHHLSDLGHQFDLQHGPDLELFLEEYEKNGKKSAVQIPENKDAIKIMTGHKSKGLEFPVVIIPNIDWSVESKQSQFLIREQGEFVYTSLSASNKLEFIKNMHSEEYNQNLLDKINLCYVMFTRPVDRLYVGNIYKKDKTRFGNYAHNLFCSQFKILDSERIETQLGERNHATVKEVTKHSNDFSPIDLKDKLWFPDISIQEELYNEPISLSEERRFGNQLHWLLSKIKHPREVNYWMNEGMLRGELERLFEPKLFAELDRILNFDLYKQLLEESDEVLSEQAIIIAPNETKRPDKIFKFADKTIVLDYKTGIANEKHIKQVQQYIKTLHTINFPTVSGIVFYTQKLEFEMV